MLTRLAFLLLVLLPSCSLLLTEAENGVELRIDSLEPQPGPEMDYVLSFSVRNSGASAVGLSRCGDNLLPELQRRTNGVWLNASAPVCLTIYDMSPLLLEPGETRRGRHPVRNRGVYRVLLGVYGRSSVVSPSFRVE
jgi:hypothetical protein